MKHFTIKSSFKHPSSACCLLDLHYEAKSCIPLEREIKMGEEGKIKIQL